MDPPQSLNNLPIELIHIIIAQLLPNIQAFALTSKRYYHSVYIVPDVNIWYKYSNANLSRDELILIYSTPHNIITLMPYPYIHLRYACKYGSCKLLKKLLDLNHYPPNQIDDVLYLAQWS